VVLVILRLDWNQKVNTSYLWKVEVRAKLAGGGTWPAIWMLGSDYVIHGQVVEK
jgi:hypothetical protein